MVSSLPAGPLTRNLYSAGIFVFIDLRKLK
jgi:hypothetical protein